MKASKLIKKLKAAIEKHGDLEVRVYACDGGTDGKPANIVAYSENGWEAGNERAEGKNHFFLWSK
jgi:hypothetical protein